jgi:acetoacetyl-CoA synthetase
MLATVSMGAIWSSCSPDFGSTGVIDRFGQIAPKVLLIADGYFYNGKVFNCLERLPEILKALPTVEQVIIIPYVNSTKKPGNHHVWDPLLQSSKARGIDFVQLPFNHPLFIMYSSGTTGMPKCIIHGAGGTLLQHMKEHQLHCDINPNDKVFYYTTCGWMMWNWLVSSLASQASLVLYDGSPTYPSPQHLWAIAEDTGITLFGTSAKYLDSLRKMDVIPNKVYPLPHLRMITSTGSPLAPESFDYVYQSIKQDVCLASISGGTDIISCFALGNPIAPVWRGELQTRGLGMRVEVFDEAGNSLQQGKGELVCTAPFPSQPLGFWNDPDGKKYHAAYFSRYPNVWHHGDFVELTEHGGMIIHGRSDAVLNPSGIRIGTAEIYRQVEQIDEVLESLVVGQNWDHDIRVVLFVRLREGATLTPELITKIKQQIRHNTTPHHVPAKIIQVSDIPRTKNGKIAELSVRNIIHGQPITNKEALANPESLELYEDLAELTA